MFPSGNTGASLFFLPLAQPFLWKLTTPARYKFSILIPVRVSLHRMGSVFPGELCIMAKKVDWMYHRKG